jgi:hypothetical protein
VPEDFHVVRPLVITGVGAINRCSIVISLEPIAQVVLSWFVPFTGFYPSLTALGPAVLEVV